MRSSFNKYSKFEFYLTALALTSHNVTFVSIINECCSNYDMMLVFNFNKRINDDFQTGFLNTVLSFIGHQTDSPAPTLTRLVKSEVNAKIMVIFVSVVIMSI